MLHPMQHNCLVPPDPVVLRADDARRATLEQEGWRVTARSWGAVLTAEQADVANLTALTRRELGNLTLREVSPSDLPAILALDAATLGDYPGGVATRHAPLMATSARPTAHRRAFGAFDALGAAENTAIRTANQRLGYVIDEEWLTLTPPGSQDR